jgi:dolichol-phosphate mannosyltransferase
METKTASFELSIVVPALNEQDNVERLVQEVEEHVRGQGVNAELIIVDDGSDDETFKRLEVIKTKTPWLTTCRHDMPLGQSAATYTGIRLAKAPVISTLDADLQNDPADLPRLLEIMRQKQCDMVQGYRARRQDSALRKFNSWVGKTTRNLLLGDAIRDTGCATRVVKTHYARQIPLQYKGMHRFIPVYTRWLGGDIIEEPVNHRPRTAGATKYGTISRAVEGLIDCIAMRWMRRRMKPVEALESLQARAISKSDKMAQQENYSGAWMSPFTSRGRYWLMAIGVLVTIFALISYHTIDIPIAKAAGDLPDSTKRIGEWMSETAKFPYIAAICALIYIIAYRLNKNQWRQWAWLTFLAGLTGGGLVNLFKIIFGRIRPIKALAEDVYGFELFRFGYDYASFPSGHSAIMGVCIGMLLVIKPRVWPIWILLFGAIAFSRVIVQAHYVGDIVAGLYVGLCSAGLIVGIANRRGKWPAARAKD